MLYKLICLKIHIIRIGYIAAVSIKTLIQVAQLIAFTSNILYQGLDLNYSKVNYI